MPATSVMALLIEGAEVGPKADRPLLSASLPIHDIRIADVEVRKQIGRHTPRNESLWCCANVRFSIEEALFGGVYKLLAEPRYACIRVNARLLEKGLRSIAATDRL